MQLSCKLLILLSAAEAHRLDIHETERPLYCPTVLISLSPSPEYEAAQLALVRASRVDHVRPIPTAEQLFNYSLHSSPPFQLSISFYK